MGNERKFINGQLHTFSRRNNVAHRSDIVSSGLKSESWVSNKK